MQIPIDIREARVEDAPFLAHAEREIAKTPGLLVSRPSELTDEKFVKKIEALSLSINGKYLVAEVDKKIVGHAMFDPLGLEAIKHVVQLTLVVHLGWQGQRIGSRLLEELISWARVTPTVEKAELHVRSSNKPAIALYKKKGFSEEGRWHRRVKVGPGQYLDDVLMGLWLK